MGFLNSEFPNYLLALKTLDLLTTFFRVIDFRKKKNKLKHTGLHKKQKKDEKGILLIIMQRRERKFIHNKLILLLLHTYFHFLFPC